MKKWIYFLIVCLIILVTNQSVAENFYIEDYRVNMKVHQDKTVDVHEEIDAFFTKASHGIIRDIPTKIGEKISHVNVNNPASVNRDSRGSHIKIGDPNRTITGQKKYVIDYTHHLRGPADEFYYNIIGNGWNTSIRHASFNIEMPKEFVADRLGLSIGKKGVRGFDGDAVYRWNKTSVSGETKRTLKPLEGMTIRMALPKGYFLIEQPRGQNLSRLFLVGIMLLATGVSVLCWRWFGKDDQVIEVVNFYPPKGYNSAEIEVLYRGKSTKKGLISLIPWFANKGLLDIVPTKFGGFKFVRKKEMQNELKTGIEAEFFEVLMDNKNERKGRELKVSRTFYEECNTCIQKLDKLKEKIYEKDSISGRFKIPFILSLLLSFFVCIYFLFGGSIPNEIFFVLPFLATGVLIVICRIMVYLRDSHLFPTLFFVIFGLCFAGLPTVQLLGSAIDLSTTDLLYIALSIICFGITAICLYHLPKRNRPGTKLLGDILGFKRFLETAELHKVTALVNQNPHYCFDVLPYLYIFGLTDKWMNRFEQFFTVPPEWYQGDSFDHKYIRIMDKTSDYTCPSTENGGISSSDGGGGFSGGGSGGGGGCSW